MNRTVAFINLIRIEACFLKMSVHIAGVNEVIAQTLAPLQKNFKSRMWCDATVEIQTMTVEAPCLSRVAMEPLWIREVDKRKFLLSVERIGIPETFCSPKVREARVHSHAGTGANEQNIRLLDGSRCG